MMKLMTFLLISTAPLTFARKFEASCLFEVNGKKANCQEYKNKVQLPGYRSRCSTRDPNFPLKTRWSKTQRCPLSGRKGVCEYLDLTDVIYIEDVPTEALPIILKEHEKNCEKYKGKWHYVP